MRSDGEHTWIDAAADPATHHPTTLAPDPACPPEHEHDFYLWDLCGCERPTTAATTTHQLRRHHRREEHAMGTPAFSLEAAFLVEEA